MSSVWSAVLQKLRVELASIARDTTSLMNATAFRRGRSTRGTTIAKLDPTPAQQIAGSRLQERLMQWHTVTGGILKRHSISTPVRLRYLVDEAIVCARLERQTRANITSSQWRREFKEELGALEAELARILDVIDTTVQHTAARTTEIVDVLITEIDEQQIRVTMTPATNTSAPPIVYLPFTPTELDLLIQKYQTPRPDRPVDLSASLAEFGHALYRDVLSPELPRSLDRARSSGSDLQLRLHLEGGVRLHHIPWEVLHDGNEFLAVARGITIARHVASERNRSDATSLRRVLITISNPKTLSPLQAGVEHDRLKAALGGLEMLGLLQIDVATDGSRNTLRRMLDTADESGRPYDAWHYIGHARFNEELKRSELAFVGDDGSDHWVGELELLPLLHAHPSLGLVVLNACNSLAFAQVLATSGIPAIVAMQFEITNEAAIAFSEELYASLIEGHDILGAVNDGRRALFCRTRGVEWMTPVLVLSTLLRSKPSLLHSRDPEGR